MSIRNLLFLTYSVTLLSMHTTYTRVEQHKGTIPTTVNPSSNNYHFKDTNVSISGTNRVHEFNVKADQKNVFLSMVKKQGKKTILEAVAYGNPTFRLKTTSLKSIGIKIENETIFKNAENSRFSIVKSSCGTVQWIIFGNQTLSFVPTDSVHGQNTTHTLEGDFIDQDLTLSDTCLVKGIVHVYAIDQNVSIRLDTNTTISNATGGINMLVLHAAEGREIKFIMDKRVDFKAKHNVPFYLIQTGPGKIKLNIIND